MFDGLQCLVLHVSLVGTALASKLTVSDTSYWSVAVVKQSSVVFCMMVGQQLCRLLSPCDGGNTFLPAAG